MIEADSTVHRRVSISSGNRTVLLCLLLAAISGSAFGDAPQSPLSFGFFAPDTNESESLIFDEAGASVVRIDVNWVRVEKEDGSWDFSAYEDRINYAVEKDRKLILVLCYSHPKAGMSGGRNGHISPEFYADFFAYIDAVHGKWGDVIYGYELWNEPNFHKYWDATDQEFFDFTREASKHIKKIAPDIPLAVGSIVIHPVLGGGSYVRRFINAGCMDYADALAVHPYGRWPSNQASWVASARSALDRRGYGDREIWITEVGYPTRTLLPYRVTEEEQPGVVAESLIRLCGAGADLVVWYRFLAWDKERVKSPNGGTWSFGLVMKESNGDYTESPALNTWGHVVTGLDGMSLIEDGVVKDRRMDPVIRAWLFGNGEGRHTLALWSRAGDQEIMVSGFSGTVNVMNSLTSHDMSFSADTSLVIGSDPLLFEFSDLNESVQVRFLYEDEQMKLQLVR